MTSTQGAKMTAVHRVPEAILPFLNKDSHDYAPDVIFFEPHHDDVALFASYALMSIPGAKVRTVLGTSDNGRLFESKHAMVELGFDTEYEAWPILEDAPDWAEVATRMQMMKYENDKRNRLLVFAPAVELDGHDHHNSVGNLAYEVFGNSCVFYLTYRRGHGRSRSGTEVEPMPNWRAKKLAALSCYKSQIDRESTRPWFTSSDVLREWLL